MKLMLIEKTLANFHSNTIIHYTTPAQGMPLKDFGVQHQLTQIWITKHGVSVMTCVHLKVYISIEMLKVLNKEIKPTILFPSDHKISKKASCTTDSGKESNKTCIFPFITHGIMFNSCTLSFSPDDTKAWCATEVDGSDKHILPKFGFCEPACQPKKLQENTTIIVTISICATLCLSSIAILSWYYIKRNKEEKEKETLLKGNIAMINDQLVLNEQAAHLSYSGEQEIDQGKFKIGRKLGGGNFGSVHEGMTEDPIHPGQKNKVAIKSVNNPLDPAQIYSLICEIKVLDHLGTHLNLVNMIGACTTQFKNGKIWLLLEYCSHGDMKKFLLRNRDDICEGLYDHSVPHEILNVRLLLKWSHSICKGMEYLASKNIMHGDLAARNILITKLNNDESYLAKIGDFGLSKAFYENASYLKQERKDIPWRWMAVDYFETGVLTVNSDVWSFGVVFWEILSVGNYPYAGGDADDTIKKIKSGFRLPVPDEIKEANWLADCYNEVAKMCWHLDPKQRSSFSDLVKTFETHLTSEEKENYKRLEQNFTESKAKISKRREPKHEIFNEAIALSDINNIDDDNYLKSQTKEKQETDEIDFSEWFNA